MPSLYMYVQSSLHMSDHSETLGHYVLAFNVKNALYREGVGVTGIVGIQK